MLHVYTRSIRYVIATLPILAMALFLTNGPIAIAQGTGCYYAGQLYSQGAQIQDACQTGQSQTCEAGGWSPCHE
jgi:hypothetical protein